MPGNVAITTSSVPAGFCFTTWSASWPQLVALLSGEGDLSVNLHIGEAPPSDLTKAWFKTISGVPDRLYLFASGVWVSKHPMPTGFTLLAPAGSTRDSIAALDGGDGDPDAAALAFTGPMWTIDTDFEARFPIGPGTFPSGTALVEGATGGEEKHALTVAEIPPHSHVVLASQSDVGGGEAGQRLRPNADEAESDVSTANTGGDGTPKVVTPHNTVPPFRVRYFIKRTSRTHYRAS